MGKKYKYNPQKGDRFNRLTFIEEVEPQIIKRKNRKDEIKRRCRFKCDCGKEVVRYLSEVVKGVRTSCGCDFKKPTPIGQRFCRLVVLREVEPKNRIRKDGYTEIIPQVQCQCDCGNIVQVRLSSLICGKTKSCGCLAREIAHKNKGLLYGIARNDYDGLIEQGGEYLASYMAWTSMLGRCYSEARHASRPSYMGGLVCDEWLLFSVFKKWFDERYDPDIMKSWHLDKDLLIKDNKVYSPQTCTLLPSEINALFQRKAYRDLPIGVSKQGNKYTSKMSINNVKTHIGIYETIAEANNAYQNRRAEYLRSKAEKYKGVIADNVYQALINYEPKLM